MHNSLKDFWWRLQLDLPDELEESIIWKLSLIGIANFSIEYSPEKISRKILFIWLPSNEWEKEDREKLFLSFEPLAKTFEISLPLPIWQKVDDEDWNLSWKEYWKPDPIGKSLLILPVWLDLPNEFSNRKIVRLDPGKAFGTGSHPTTRLCLERLEIDPPNGLRVADVGCGSGILGITALAFGAKEVFAIDKDSLAVHSTLENFAINDFENSKFFTFKGSIEVLQSKLNKASIDLLLCNIIAPVIKKLSPEFDSIIAPNGRALLSGLLQNQVMGITEYLQSLGWQIVGNWDKDNWTLLEICRN